MVLLLIMTLKNGLKFILLKGWWPTNGLGTTEWQLLENYLKNTESGHGTSYSSQWHNTWITNSVSGVANYVYIGGFMELKNSLSKNLL